ncbi:MAG TPA: ubiquinol-cytochrome c reductase iron-sulfur subunit [Acidobacteriota bacterium]|jgi:Rieske Fe-S protein
MDSRREFFKTTFWFFAAIPAGILSALTLGAAFSPVFKKSGSLPQGVDLGEVGQIPDNAPQVKMVEILRSDGWNQQRIQRKVFVVKSGGKVRVFSPVCTHLGCQVDWDESDKKFNCPCHGGQYNLNGDVVAGPPPRPLEEIPAEIRDNKLVIRSG